jgi:hypothetical protein
MIILPQFVSRDRTFSENQRGKAGDKSKEQQQPE